jgi:hypothetical protein
MRRGVAFSPPAEAARSSMTGPGSVTTRGNLLPTPRAHDGTSNGLGAKGKQGGRTLLESVRLLPTPRARDGKGRDPNPRGVDLNEAIALLPTPRASVGGPCVGSPKKSRLEQEIALLPDAISVALDGTTIRSRRDL